MQNANLDLDNSGTSKNGRRYLRPRVKEGEDYSASITRGLLFPSYRGVDLGNNGFPNGRTGVARSLVSQLSVFLARFSLPLPPTPALPLFFWSGSFGRFPREFLIQCSGGDGPEEWQKSVAQVELLKQDAIVPARLRGISLRDSDAGRAAHRELYVRVQHGKDYILRKICGGRENATNFAGAQKGAGNKA